MNSSGQTFSQEYRILSNIDFLINSVDYIRRFSKIQSNKKVSYYNMPAAFDIETTSFYQNGQVLPENKRGIMYHWQFGIGDGLTSIITTGRTWESFTDFLSKFQTLYNLDENNRVIVYVHNLPFEFQWMRKHFDWDKVFLLDERKPVYALTGGIEFRCSLKLAGGKALAKVGDDLQKYHVQKLVGDLDYSVLRSPLTPLSDAELQYCINDIRVVLSYIQEKIEQDGDITQIPLTNTGYVRNFCRKSCYSKGKWRKYRNIMESLTLTSDEYSQLKRGFQGGFTHANSHYVGTVQHNVASYDLTSSYPSVMLLEKFPMSKAHLIEGEISQDEFIYHLRTHCCLFDAEFFDVVPKLTHEHAISSSKCYALEKMGLLRDNGRLVTAQHFKITCTEQDFYVYAQFYSWSDCRISNFRWYDKNYLPLNFAKSILELYTRKTVLKGVEGEEVNYMISKNMANSAYGMAVTDIVRNEISYENGTFQSTKPDLEKSIEKYNNNIRRFLYYPWGVWVTAYARANLFSAIINLGNDYIYSDTDSVKFLNHENHSDYFERYNNEIMEKIQKVAEHRKQDPALYSPKNQKGSAKTIGIWDFEGIYDDFKTLGAKRYLTRRGDEWTLTLAGASKKSAKDWLVSTGDPLTRFTHEMEIPSAHSGRLTMTYIDDEASGTLVDCNGIPYHYTEASSVHMEPSTYNLTMSDEFINYLLGAKDLDWR